MDSSGESMTTTKIELKRSPATLAGLDFDHRRFRATVSCITGKLNEKNGMRINEPACIKHIFFAYAFYGWTTRGPATK
jgi:hypothetical protein